jgi:hypothetical protein
MAQRLDRRYSRESAAAFYIKFLGREVVPAVNDTGYGQRSLVL